MNLYRRFLMAIVALVGLSSSESLAQITLVKTITNSSKTTGTSLALTIPAGGIAAGNSIIVSFAMDPATGTVSCTDSASNSYANDRDQVNGSGTSGVRTVILSAHNVTALVSGNTITCTHPSVAARALSASEFSGLLASGAKDQTMSAAGQSTSPSSGNTGTTTQATELLIGAIGVEGPSGDTFTPGASYTTIGRGGTSGGNAATNITIDPEYRVVTATGAYAATGTLSNSRQWAAAIVTYKAKPPPAINTVTPGSGPIATPVTIGGSNFGATQGTSTVTFNGVAATPTSWTANSITVPVPATASTGPVVVTVSGAASNGVTFTVTYSPRVNAGGSAYTDGSGNYWAADRDYGSGPWGYFGGSMFSTGDPIANTTDDVLYQTERFGNFSYKFDVPNGKYDIAIHLAEIWFTSAGQRFAKILIEGAVVLDNYDIFTEVGHDAAVIKTFYGIDVQDGQLNIDFVPISNNAKVSAIAISPARPTKLVITSVNSGNPPIAGVGFPVVIQAQNPNGVPLNVSTATNVSLSKKTGGGNLGGTTSGTIAAGTNQVTINGVTYSKNDFGVSLTATATSGDALTPGDSAPFTVIVGIPTMLGFIFQPANSTTSGAIKGPPTVAVQDSAGNTITSSSAAITVAIATNPGGGTLTGTTVRNAANGVGAFADLKINQVGNGYTLTATSPGLTGATTTAFNIASGGNVGGTVTKAAGGGAITGASVEALQAGVVKGTASTNSAGSYTISGLAPGTYDIRADAGGFSPQTQSGLTINAGATTTANFSLATANPTAGIVYIYDELLRLKSVIDPVGEAATYAYDAVGNLLSITRNTSSQTSIIDFNPNSGAVGTGVTIYGTGYSGTPGQNTVTFNGVAATVISSTLTQIVTTVPAGATAGAIAVTSPAGSAASGTSFTVGSAAAPTITTFTPAMGIAGTPITITGTNFDTTAVNNEVRFNPIFAAVTSSTQTTINTAVPIGARPGPIRVSNMNGTGVSSQDFFIIPPPYSATDVDFTGRLSIGGSLTMSVGAANKIALALFDGTAGQRISVRITNSTFPDGGASTTSAVLKILKPDGSQLSQIGWHSPNGGLDENFIDVQALPVTGAYTIMVDPSGTYTGQALITLYNVPAENQGTITPGGSPVTAVTPVPGQNARFTFTATPNQIISALVTGSTYPDLGSFTTSAYLRLLKPDGSQQAVIGWHAYDPQENFMDAQKLVASGTYTLQVDPRWAYTGQATVTLYNVPAENQGTITPGGPAVTVITTVPGQNGGLTFVGNQNDVITATVNNSTYASEGANLRVINPDGSVLTSVFWTTSTGTTLPATTLPVSGTYTLLVDPVLLNTGQVNVQMSIAPNTLTLSYGGKLRDRVGQGDLAMSADGSFDGTFTVGSQTGSGNRTVTYLLLSRPTGTWDTTPNSSWILGAASTLDGALLNNISNGNVNFSFAEGTTFNIFASDNNNNNLFVSGTNFLLTVNFSGGSTEKVYATVP